MMDRGFGHMGMDDNFGKTVAGIGCLAAVLNVLIAVVPVILVLVAVKLLFF